MNRNDKKPANRNKGLVNPNSIKEWEVYKQTTLMEFLMFKMPDAPRKTIKSLLTNHQVSVGGVPTSQYNFPLYPEDVVIVSKNRIAKHDRRPLPIIYEDEDIIAINKPSGLLSVATDREKGRTAYRLVSDYVVSKNPKARIHVVHRLDEDTSGVLIFAKSHEVREALQNSWQEIVSCRAYYAVVEGEMEQQEGTLRDYLTQNDLHLVYVTKNKTKGKLAVTNYKVIKYKAPFTLLDVHIDSGRKNQIRVQLGNIGHHVIGDDKYGEPANPINRLGLHAYQLTFVNPLNGKAYDIKTDMPEELKKHFFHPRKSSGTPAVKKPERPTRSATRIKKGKQRRTKKRG